METIQPSTSTPPPPITPPASSRIFPLLPVLFLLIVLLLGSTAYLAYQNMQLAKELRTLKEDYSSPPPTPTITPTNSTQTYSNKEHMFSFDYPADMTIKPIPLPLYGIELSFPDNQYKVKVITGSPANWCEGCKQEYVANTKAKFFNYPPTQEFQNAKLYEDSGILFTFENPLSAKTPIPSEKVTVFNQIVDSFKFTYPSVVTQKKFGYIKGITWSRGSGPYYLSFDEAIYDGVFRITNPETTIRDYPIATNPSITLQTYSHKADGDFTFDEILPFPTFISLFSETSSSSSKNVPYWIELENGTVTKITEQYRQ